MWFTRLSIQRPVFVVVLMLTIVVLGRRSMSSINIDLNPPVNFPYVSVTTAYPGTSSEEIESAVTKPIEDAVSSITGIEHITSSSQFGRSLVTVQFAIGKNPTQAQSEVREKVDAARGALPRDTNPPIVQRFDFSDQPVITAGVVSDLSLKQIRFQVQKIAEPLIGQVDGVARVDVTGGDVREIQVQVDRSRLTAYGITIADLVNAIQAANINVAAGHIVEGRYDVDARVIGEFQSVEQIRNLRIPVPSRDPAQANWINLSDVATVSDTVAERSNIARIWSRGEKGDGPLKPAEVVTLVVTKSTDANTVNVVNGVKQTLEKLKTLMPGHPQFIITMDSSRIVMDQLRDIIMSLMAGSILAVLVVYFFLHDLRGTFICGVAIPLSLTATFIPLYFAGFTLNSMTMLGLSLVVGILVDDSIVVLENIYRHLRRGELPREAAYNGRSEIGLAAITITLVDVAVFFPMAWMGGVVGQFFRQFGLTVACATLFSLFVSFSVTPMLASRLYRSSADVEHREGSMAAWFERRFSALDNLYRRLLGAALRTLGRRLLVVVVGVLLLVLTMVIAGPKLGFQFVPVTDQGQVIVNCELPAGSSMDATDAVTRVIEGRMTDIPEIKTMFTSIGSLGGGFGIPKLGPQYCQVNATLIDKPSALQSILPWEHGGRHRPDVAIAAELRKRLSDIPGARIVVVNVSGFGGSAAPVDIQLLGFDLKHMEAVANQLKVRLASVPGLMNPDISLRPGKPEAEVIVDRTKAASFGFSVQQIGNLVRQAFAGDTTAKFRDQGDQFDIDVKLRDLDRANVEQIGDLIVGYRGPFGSSQPIHLRDVSSIVLGSGPTAIERVDRQRVVHVSAYLQPGIALGNIQKDVNAAIVDVPLGDIILKWGGQAEQMAREFPYLFGTLFMSIILVYLLMAALFDSLFTPIVIQLSLPMALIGAILALVITHKSMSIISMIGVIMLVGLVQKNAILLVDYANTLRARGVPRNEAVQMAGATRLRPILMTTVAMVFGMMPIALGVGASSESRSPLAICVIGGLIVSTVLTLVMIPVLYTLLDGVLGTIVRYTRILFRMPESAGTQTRVRRSTGEDGH